MRILVSGMARGGTCLLTEVVRGLGIVKFTVVIEEKKFLKYKELPANYGTKFTVDSPAFTLDIIARLMDRYADFYIVFSLRHPLDVFMARLLRVKSIESDFNVAMSRIEKFHSIYKAMLNHYPDRVLAVKMEELILHPDREVRRVAKFFGVAPRQQALEFYKYNRNKYHQKRYKGQLNASQVGIHKRWETMNDGFFKSRADDILAATTRLYKIIKDLGYEV